MIPQDDWKQNHSIENYHYPNSKFGKRLQRRSSNLSTTSAAFSFILVADSIFSMLSGSLNSSVQGPLGASERLALLIFEHETLYPLCFEAVSKISIDRFERNLRRLIRLFSGDLQQEATTPQQTRLARHVKYLARNSAFLICSRLDTHKYSNKKDMGTGEVSDNSDIDELADEPTDFLEFETFIINSGALDTFAANLRQFVHPRTKRIIDLPDCEPDRILSESLNDEDSSLNHRPPRLIRKRHSNSVRSVVASFKNIIFKPLLRDGMKRVEWTCVRNDRARKLL